MNKKNASELNTQKAKNRKGGSKKVVPVSASEQVPEVSKKKRFRYLFYRKTAIHFYASEIDAINSGVTYKDKEYVTHTKLDHKDSAVYTFMRGQKIGILAIVLALTCALILNPTAALGIIIAVLSTIYFIDAIFTLYLVRKNLDFPSEIQFTEAEIAEIDDKDLPKYTVLSPMYKEFEVLPDFVENMKSLNYPKDKLEIMLLLEENDHETVALAEKLKLPSYFTVEIVPHSYPKTKPKACNYGLWKAKGEYVVIYDAEDKPDPNQLKKAYLAFKRLGDKTACVQAKLNYFNSNQNLLTRFFTAEYSLWFDVILPGFQSINTAIPLGGTSNHFKTELLKKIHGWDAFNVTEDCDLGIRLFKQGFTTAIIDSVTMEEANSNVKNWIRQRSRWIKGYLQTYLVHMRQPLKFLFNKGWHWAIFQLVIGMRISFIVINPILWAMTIAYFVFFEQVGSQIEALYPAPVFYMAVFSLVFGNFVYLYNYMIGLAKRGRWDLIKYVFLVPIYWLLMAFGAWMAIYQLIVKPHHWEKTNHGLAKDKKREWKIAASFRRVDWAFAMINLGLILLAVQLGLTFSSAEWATLAIEGIFYIEVTLVLCITAILCYEAGIKLGSKIQKKFKISTEIIASIVFIGAGFGANFLNYLYNAYLTRTVTIEDFGVISLVGSFLFIITIPLTALLRAISQKVAFHLGRDRIAIATFWKFVRKRSFLISVVFTVLWMALIPMLAQYFNMASYVPLLIISPMFILVTVASVDQGYLNGMVKFYAISFIIIVEALSKLILTWALVSTGNSDYVYLAIPVSLLIALLTGYFFAVDIKSENRELKDREEMLFPTKLFTSYTITRFAVIAYLTFDVLLAKHYLSPADAGKYALIALEGKIIFLLGTIIAQPLIPLVSKKLGERKDTTKTFFALLGTFTLISTVFFIGIGVFGAYTAPILLGNKAYLITDLLPFYSFGILCFSIASFVISYKQVLNKHLYAGVSFVLAIVQIVTISVFHASLNSFVYSMAWVGALNLAVVLIVHIFERHVVTILRNIADFGDIFKDKVKLDDRKDGLRILIFNWRDIKHVWAGGAEVYIHEIGKRFVAQGNQVTVICGNDQWNKRHEQVDGVNIVRIGGFFTVYVWAFIYYISKLRGKYDMIIDCENGVPFFTPLYTKTPVVGLVHHVHQDVFRKNLPFGAYHFACFLEAKLMPLVYRNVPMVTVSMTSKKDMEKINLGKSGIEIVNPGVDPVLLDEKNWHPKTTHPQVLYLGRIRPYKSLDVAIKAMKIICEQNAEARLVIAGFGENQDELKKLTKQLKLENHVIFTGHVSEEEKIKYLSESWVFVQPSQMEGWGISVIEANATGTPVVAANVPGLRESVQNPHTGYLVTYGDVEEFANKIMKLLDNEKLREQYKSNSVKWAEKFSWDASAEAFLIILKRRFGNDE